MLRATTDYMARALVLARQAQAVVSPNPGVGAVLIRDGVIVGQGRTQPPGGPHAEIVALRQAGERARGATLYSTLEPCCFTGRTGPCTEAIVRAGVSAVHMATLDPNPRVSGQGRTCLEAAGIATVTGEHQQQARELIEGFAKWIAQGIPFVTVKYAMTLDGKIASRSGDSKWISNDRSRRLVHRLRMRSDLVMVGVATVLADNPQLNVRLAGPPQHHQPLRLVVDTRCRTPLDARLLNDSAVDRTVLAVGESVPEEQVRVCVAKGAQVWRIPERDGHVDLRALASELGTNGVTSVLLEGGGSLIASALQAGIVDKVVAFVAPKIAGGRECLTPVEGHGVETMASATSLRDVRVRQISDDVMMCGYVNGAAASAGEQG